MARNDTLFRTVTMQNTTLGIVVIWGSSGSHHRADAFDVGRLFMLSIDQRHNSSEYRLSI